MESKYRNVHPSTVSEWDPVFAARVGSGRAIGYVFDVPGATGDGSTDSVRVSNLLADVPSVVWRTARDIGDLRLTAPDPNKRARRRFFR